MIVEGNDPATQASFTLRNRAARATWQVVWLLLFRPSPRPFHAWRAFLLRAFGAKLGSEVHVYPAVRIWAPWNLRIGDHVGVGDHVDLYCMATIEIGERAVVSQGAHLCCGSHDYNSSNFQLFAKPIWIGPRAWICAGAFVGPGVRIAEGVVVGARAVATKPLEEPYAVYAGNPCRKVALRKRKAEGADTP